MRSEWQVRRRAARPSLRRCGRKLVCRGLGGNRRCFQRSTRMLRSRDRSLFQILIRHHLFTPERAKALALLEGPPPQPSHDPRAKLLAPPAETPCAEARFAQIVTSPNTHVPVVVCRSAGIWTRGQSTALGRPAAGGEPANPAKRGTRLEATTDRAFLVSAGPPKVGVQRGLSILPGVRTGHFLVQTMALIA